MLTLLRLEVKGFGPFADRAVLSFPEEQGVTVLYGDNMRGKTSLMNAIRFAFFGEAQLRGAAGQRILAACNRDLVGSGEYGFRVDLSIRHEDENLEIIREVTPRVDVPTSDMDFLSRVALRRGGVVVGPGQGDSLLRSILPEDVARFFLFDGELLDQYAELLIRESESGRVISEAIEHILGVPILRDARDHLGQLAAKTSRMAAKEAAKHQATKALGVALQEADQMRRFHSEERDRKKAELRELRSSHEEIRAELGRQEIYQAALQRLDRAQEDLKAAQVTQETKSVELKAAMKESWRTVLAEPIARARVARRKAVEEAFESVLASLRAEAIGSRRCPVCGQDLSEHESAALTASLPLHSAAEIEASDPGAAVSKWMAELEGFEEKDVRAEVRLIYEAIREARRAETKARSQITDANQILDDQDPAELRRRQTTLTELAVKIHATREAISEEQRRVESQDANISRLAKHLEAAGNPELAVFQQREKTLGRARAVFERAVDGYKEVLRDRVQRSATKLFLRMTTEKEDYTSLTINEHYGLTIVHRDGRTEGNRSAGAEQVVALALVGALQANAPLRGPIVMDTPFGRLDPGHTANVVSALPSMAEQVILLVQEGEIDRVTVRSLLAGHLRREYQLERETARRTVIREAR